MSDSEDDIPLAQRNLVAAKNNKIERNSSKINKAEYSSSDDDIPLAQKLATLKKEKPFSPPTKVFSENKPKIGVNGAKRKVKEESASDSDSDVPLAKKVKKPDVKPIKKEKEVSNRVASSKSVISSNRKRPAPDDDNDTKPKAVKKTTKKADSDDEIMSSPNKMKKSKGKEKSNDRGTESRKRSKKETSNEESEEEETHKWWEQKVGTEDNTQKWTTLEHAGVMFPPDYIPHGVKMLYNGKPVHLEPEAEEVATFFAALLETDHGNNPTFQKNFFNDWQEILKKSSKNPSITDFSKCNFVPIWEYLEKLKETKKNMTKEEKVRLKQEKLKAEEPFMYALVDGRKEKVGNFRIEPPALFRGRGDHPKTGSLKKRVMPEQVTINIGEGAPVPKPPEGHKWAEVKHDNTVTWLATWQENVNNQTKYVFLAANSTWKGMSDMSKFEKARELKKHVDKIRKDYHNELKDKMMAVRQRATAMYLIDRLALRAGNEKGDEEADTVGCCSLRYEHVTLRPPNIVVFDFLGKDSIRYHNEVPVLDQVFKNLRIFKKEPKKEGDMLFDRLNTSQLNKHLSSYMKGLTAKVFRTYNASHVFQEELRKTDPNDSIADKLLAYNRANRQVAILCNHQRSVSKGHEKMMERIEDKIRALKYQRLKIKQTMLTIDPKLKKKRPSLTEESDIDDEWIINHERELMDKEREKIESKWTKDNEKLEEEGKPKLTEKELKKQLKEVDEHAAELAAERRTGKVEPKKGVTLEKLEQQLEKMTERIAIAKTQRTDKDENKTTALSTSKINYIDPRISAAWCYKYKVPIEKVFNKTLKDKFQWALEVNSKWEF